MPSEAPLIDHGTAILIDRAIRATVERFDVVLPAAAAEERLGRAPDVDANGIRAWGGVRPEQVAELLELCGDQDGIAAWRDTLAQHAARDVLITLRWRTDR